LTSKSYGEIHRGVYIVRGENVALLGEIDLELEDKIERENLPGSLNQLKQVPYEEIEKIYSEKLQNIKQRDQTNSVRLKVHGLNVESFQDNLY
jgi:U6 snRNA-associated Sm-like protein LSm1